MTASTSTLTIPARYCGPPSSGNGGWSAGALAQRLLGDDAPDSPRRTVRVMLRKPPPLDTALTVVVEGGQATASDGDVLIAGAAIAAGDLEPVEPVPAETARAAEASYAALESHPFETCFACGTARAEGDGLRIFPGRVADDTAGRVRVAAGWVPDPSIADEDHPDIASLPATWAALDCVGGWAGDLAERLMVLGSMTAEVLVRPRVGEEVVVVGGARGTEGRKTFTASSLYAADGTLLALAEHVWFAVDPAAFR